MVSESLEENTPNSIALAKPGDSMSRTVDFPWNFTSRFKIVLFPGSLPEKACDGDIRTMQMLADFATAGFRQAITGPKKLRKTSTKGTASAVHGLRA
jgi:hypothetical protein